MMTSFVSLLLVAFLPVLAAHGDVCTSSEMRATLNQYIESTNDANWLGLRALFLPSATLKVGVDAPYLLPMLSVQQRMCIASKLNVELTVARQPTVFGRDQLDVNVTYRAEQPSNASPPIELAFVSEERFFFAVRGDKCLIASLWLPWSTLERDLIVFNTIIDECLSPTAAERQ